MLGPDIVTSENNKGISIVDDLFDWRVAPSVPVPCEASIVLNDLGQYMSEYHVQGSAMGVLQGATNNPTSA